MHSPKLTWCHQHQTSPFLMTCLSAQQHRQLPTKTTTTQPFNDCTPPYRSWPSHPKDSSIWKTCTHHEPNTQPNLNTDQPLETTVHNNTHKRHTHMPWWHPIHQTNQQTSLRNAPENQMRNSCWTLFCINWPFLPICHLHPTWHKFFPLPTAFTTLLMNIINDNIPTPIHPYFTSQYVLALHKDPDDLNKLWPIGIRTALRCLAASLITTIYATNFATYLIPNGQFGIACPGSLNFIYHTMQAQMELLLTDPDHSSHALLLLNIVNMFNAVSQDACHMTLASHPIFSALLPFFDLLYTEANQFGWV